jgi:hypothetical protein
MESTVEVLERENNNLWFKLYQAEQQAAATTPAHGSVIVSKDIGSGHYLQHKSGRRDLH